MITLYLTEEEEKILLNMIEERLNELHTEICHTDDHEYRIMLKNRKAVILKLQNALRQSENSAKESMVTP
ncbi:MAG: hypothetical protein ABFD44_05860 [Anaerolineaceae bacterium]